jgi:hypothetical protein
VDDWGNPAAWTPNGVPQSAGDDATIAGGTVILNASYSVGALTLGGGVIAGTNDLTLGGLLTWTGGAFVDAGTVRATAGIVISGADKIVDSRTIVSDGLATWGGGNLITANGARIVNNGTFVASFGGDVQSQGAATFFDNAGVLRKTGGAGGTSATTISAVFNSGGTVQVLAGRLALAGGGSASGGFELSAGTELVLRNGYAFGAASTVGGSGGARFEFGDSTVAGAYAVTGTTTVAGGTVDFAGAATTGDLVLSGGALNGGGTVTASGAVTWTGTVLQGAGRVVANGTLEISGPDHGLGGRTLVNAGVGTWSGGNIQFSGGASLVNTGTLSTTFAGSMETSGAGAGSFVNAGLFDRAGAGATLVNPVLVNNGTVRVSEGALTLAGGGSGTGRFEVLPAARLRVVNDYLFAAGSRVSGGGVVEFAGGVNTVAGEYDVAGGTEVLGGVTTFTGTVANLGPALTLAGGVARFDTPAAVQAQRLEQSGGALEGGGQVVFNGLVTWAGGAQRGAGTTTAAAGLVISGAGPKALEGRTVVNAVGSTGTWSAGDILGSGNGTLRNDGTFLMPFDASFVAASGSPQFLNTGLLVKSGGTGLASFSGALNNTGTVRVDAGGIYLGAGSSSGRIDLAGGGAQFAAYTLADGGSVTGTNKGVVTGVLSVTGAATAARIEQGPGAQMSGPGALTIESFDWLGGRLTGGGTTTVTSSLALAGLGKEVDGRTLRIAAGAVAAWSAGDLAVSAGSSIDNAGTIDNSYDGNVFQAGAVNNAGLFVKSGGAGVTASLAAFNNSGTVRVSSGRMFLGAGLSTGHFDLAGGGIDLSGGYGLGDGATITGTNAARVFGAVNVTGAAAARFVQQGQGGEQTGAGNWTIEHFDWTGGRLTGSGTTTVSADVRLAGGGKEIEGRTLRILPGATATWSAGDIGGFPGARVENGGTFDTTFDGNALYAVTPSAAFVNTGLFVKSAGTGRTTVNVFFHNAGTARVESGAIVLSGGGSSTGHFDLAGGPLELLGGYALGAGTTITGTNAARIVGDVAVTGPVAAKSVVHSNGVVGGGGALTVETYDWQGGTLGGGGTTTATVAVNLVGGAQKSIDGRTLRVAQGAVATWSAGDLRAGGGGAIENLGTFVAGADGAAFPGDGVAARFVNAGLLEKTGGTGATSISLPLVNTGVVRVSSGSVVLGGGGSSSGQFDLLAGPLDLATNYTLNAGATVTGTHRVRLAGDVTVNGAVSANRAEHLSGTLRGGGTFTVDNLVWRGGAQVDAGVTSVTSALTITGAAHGLDGRRLVVGPAATATWSSGTLFAANGARIENNGVMLNAHNGSVVYQTGVLPTFENAGEFRKVAGNGATDFGIRFNNTGTARVETGTLRLGSGGAASGHFDMAVPTAAVELAFDYALDAGATFTGPGRVRVTGGVTTVNAALTVARLEQTAGTLAGAGHLSVGTFDWKGGTLTGGGTATVTAALTIDGADLNLVGRTLAVAPGATAAWASGDVRFAQGGTIANAGTFDIAADVIPTRIDGVDAFFRNTGTLRKTGGTNFAAFAGVVLDNVGTLDVASGTLIATVSQFDPGAQALTGGTWRVGNGAKLDLGGGPGIATSHAAVTLDGPTANFPKINDLADNRGSLTLTGGKQFVTGGVFTNSGTVAADAASGVTFGNVFANAAGGRYTSAGTTAANFVFNAGTLTQSGPLTVNVQMVNSGPGGEADVSGPQTWGDGAHLIVDGGTVRLRTDAGSAGAPRLVIDANGGVTELRATQHLKGLTVGGGRVKVIGGGGGSVVVRTGGYTPGAGGGQVDLADNKLIVDYTGASPLATIRDQIVSGFNAGGAAWAGAGIVSSTAGANGSRGLGYAEAGEVPGALAAFGGEVVGGPAVLVRYTLAGDATLDGTVDFNDLVRLAQNYERTVSDTTDSWWFSGDFTYDGVVDFNDLVKLAQNYEMALPSEPIAGAPAEFGADLAMAFASVPEPSAGLAVLAALGLAGVGRRRRRRR